MHVYFSVIMAQKKPLQLNFWLDKFIIDGRMKPVIFFSSLHYLVPVIISYKTLPYFISHTM